MPDGKGCPPVVVTAIVVTYPSGRTSVCIETAERAGQSGAHRIIIVGNGLSPTELGILEHYAESTHHSVQVFNLPDNMGPAAGLTFGAGKARTDADGAVSLLWLLDDDNWAEVSTLRHQLEVWKAAPSRSTTAVAALRGDRPAHRRLQAGEQAELVFPPPGAFLYQDAWQRVRPPRPASAVGPGTEAISIPYGPFGGLLLTMELFQTMGGPRLDYVLYEDDTDFTYRIASYGCLLLARNAFIIDGIRSWSQEERPRRMPPQLSAGSDFQVYYSTRNRVHFERGLARHHALRFCLNAGIFLLVIGLGVVLSPRRWRRSMLIYRAVFEGWTGQLGRRDAFPLPASSKEG